MILTVDIETIPDFMRSELFVQKPDEDLEASHKRLALDPDCLMIVGLNYAVDDEPARSGWVGETINGQELTETDLLQTFWGLKKKADALIGFNILRFDLPALLTRSAILKVAPQAGFKLWDAKPWQTDTLIDVFKLRYSTAERSQAKSLKELRRIFQLSIPSEFDEVLAMDGGSVEKLYLDFVAGNDEALRLLKLYGRCDVATTRALYSVWKGYLVP